MALVEEVANADHENLVAWRGGCRWMRRFERLSLPPVNSAQLPLKPRGVYLITGGLGGIGLTVAHWLAGQRLCALGAYGTNSAPAARRMGQMAGRTWVG